MNRQSTGIKKYGIHVILCVMVITAATAINRQINLEREHQYQLSEGVETLYKDITEVQTDGKWFVLSGWGFDKNYYNSSVKCEIILKETVSEKTIWPKMKQTQTGQSIPETYIQKKNCTNGTFEAKVKTRELEKDAVYEIFLRYSCESPEPIGHYIRTVRTNYYLKNGEVSSHFPGNFVEPNLTGFAQEEALRQAKLFHYYLEGMWVYYDDEKMYFLIEEALDSGKQGLEVPIFWHTLGESGYIPNYISQNGVDHKNGMFLYEKELPPDETIEIETGLYLNGGEGWLFRFRGILK